MKQDDLARILRATAHATGRRRLLVIGSQAILGHFSEHELPPETTVSAEADLVVEDDKGRDAIEAINGTVGEFSEFHRHNGIYAEGVSIDVAVLPAGWASRLKSWKLKSSAPATPRFLMPADLAASKLARGDLRDMEFVIALVRHGNIPMEQLRDAVEALPVTGQQRHAVLARLNAVVAGSRHRGGVSRPPQNLPRQPKGAPKSVGGQWRQLPRGQASPH